MVLMQIILQLVAAEDMVIRQEVERRKVWSMIFGDNRETEAAVFTREQEKLPWKHDS